MASYTVGHSFLENCDLFSDSVLKPTQHYKSQHHLSAVMAATATTDIHLVSQATNDDNNDDDAKQNKARQTVHYTHPISLQ